MSNYTDIIARLEKLTGRDRELDCDIWLTVNRMLSTEDEFWQTVVDANKAGRGDIPKYTGSIDAALTLVPEGMVWIAGIDYELPGYAHINDVFKGNFNAQAATPAIALCIAALKARAGQP